MYEVLIIVRYKYTARGRGRMQTRLGRAKSTEVVDDEPEETSASKASRNVSRSVSSLARPYFRGTSWLSSKGDRCIDRAIQTKDSSPPRDPLSPLNRSGDSIGIGAGSERLSQSDSSGESFRESNTTDDRSRPRVASKALFFSSSTLATVTSRTVPHSSSKIPKLRLQAMASQVRWG